MRGREREKEREKEREYAINSMPDINDWRLRRDAIISSKDGVSRVIGGRRNIDRWRKVE